MQRVHRRVVHRPTPGHPEVPARVDRGPAGRGVAGLGLLLLVEAAERGTADRPRQVADRPFPDQLTDPGDLRPQHLAGRRRDMEPGRGGGLDQVVGLGHRGRHRLVHVHVLARLERLLALLVVQSDRGRDRHHVDVGVGEQVLVALVPRRDAVALGRGLRPSGGEVADGVQAHPVGDVVLAEMGQDPPLGDHARPHDADANGVRHRSASRCVSVCRCRDGRLEGRDDPFTRGSIRLLEDLEHVDRVGADRTGGVPDAMQSIRCSTPSRWSGPSARPVRGTSIAAHVPSGASTSTGDETSSQLNAIVPSVPISSTSADRVPCDV